VPEGVISKGVWLKRDGQKVQDLPNIDWSSIPDLNLDFELTDEDFQFSIPVGIEMVNDVITKPYSVAIDTHEEHLADNHNENYLVLIDKNGNWRVNTMIKGFSTGIQGFASSYSCTGDIILIGKSVDDMKKAFYEIKKMKGGIVLVEDNEVVVSLPLTLGGLMYDGDVELLIEIEQALKQALAERGYTYGDAIYTMLFLASTHLPYIRITPRGIYDVMKKSLLIPAVMR